MTDEELRRAEHRLLAGAATYACGGYIARLDALHRNALYTRLAYDRLERKYDVVRELFAESDSNWNQTFYVLLFRTIGDVTNRDAFLTLARRVSYRMVLRERASLHAVEAMLIGASGLLDNYRDDAYTRSLKQDFDYFSRKYEIAPMTGAEWNLRDIRPANHPLLRIAQLAAFLASNDFLIDRLVECRTAEEVRRRTQIALKKATERAHILAGLKKATDIVDELIATIRACKGGMSEAKAAIMEQFGFDDPQADAIVKLQLGRLAGLEILKIEEELSGLQAKIEDWEDILAHDARVLEIVKNELLDMKKRFGDERRTEIQSVTGEVDIEDLIAEEQCVYTLTEAGYIKRQLKATYQAQKRGGRGISGMTRKEEDIVQEMFVGSTHDYVLFVTDRGRLFRVKGYTISEGSRTSKGSNIVNLLQLAEGEKVTNMLCYPKDEDNKGGFVTMVTKQGLIKRTPLEQYANIRKTGLIGIALNEGDALAWTRLTTGNDMLIVATRNGQAIRFNEADARPMGRSGHGVRAIKLAEGDEVVGVCICREGGTVLTVTENGKGRRSDIDTYRITARGGKGIRNYDASKDKVAAVKIVDDIDDVLLSSQEGIIIRLHANEIPVQSRYGSGVRVMRLGENDKVMVLARTDHDDEAQTESIESDAEDEPTAEQLAEMEAADEASAAEAPEADTGDEE